MNKPLAFASMAEGATGIGLAVLPSLVGRLLLGVELSGVTIVVARVAGIALLALGIACWPNPKTTRAGLSAMLLYGLIVTGYLTFVALRGEWVGPLLWPAIVLHAVITILLGYTWLIDQGSPNGPLPSANDSAYQD